MILKKEKTPSCINKDGWLVELYKNTDLEFSFVYECCKSLKPLKGVDINLQQVEFWFREFIRMGWNKIIFSKQFEAIKRATLYNRIDFENWLKTEMMYNENDFNFIVKQRVDSIIAKGKFLKDKEVELSEEDKKAVEAAIAMENSFKYSTSKLDLIDNYKKILREKA